MLNAVGTNAQPRCPQCARGLRSSGIGSAVGAYFTTGCTDEACVGAPGSGARFFGPILVQEEAPRPAPIPASEDPTGVKDGLRLTITTLMDLDRARPSPLYGPHIRALMQAGQLVDSQAQAVRALKGLLEAETPQKLLIRSLTDLLAQVPENLVFTGERLAIKEGPNLIDRGATFDKMLDDLVTLLVKARDGLAASAA